MGQNAPAMAIDSFVLLFGSMNKSTYGSRYTLIPHQELIIVRRQEVGEDSSAGANDTQKLIQLLQGYDCYSGMLAHNLFN